MSGHKAIRRIKALRASKSAAQQMLMTTFRELLFLRLLSTESYAGRSMKDLGVTDFDGQVVYKFWEDFGCVECVGNYKWVLTPKGRAIEHRLGGHSAYLFSKPTSISN